MRSAERENIRRTKRALRSAGLMRRRRKKIPKRFFAVLLAAIVLTLAVLTDKLFFPVDYLWAYASQPQLQEREEGQFRVFFLDAGQGDCTLVQLPDGQFLMIDCGNGDTESLRTILGFCLALGVGRIDRLFVTHGDSDHIGGLEAVLRCFGAGTVYFPNDLLAREEYADILQMAESYSEEVCSAQALTSFFAEREENFWYGMVLSGFLDGEEENENDSSAILYLEYAGRRLLFPGDISSRVEEELVTAFAQTDGVIFEVPVRTSFGNVLLAPVLKNLDFLKASHHGSSDATGAAFCEYVQPQNVFFSCGAGNSYGHPSQQPLQNLVQAVPSAQFYRTDELGNIMLTIEQNGEFTVLAV